MSSLLGNLELQRSHTAASNDTFRVVCFPVPAVNPVKTNHLYVAYADKGTNADDKADVFLVSSTNLAGYISWGTHSSLGAYYSTNTTIQWPGNSGWWIIETVESFNGQRYEIPWEHHGRFPLWFSSNAFGGANYSNTPVGAVTHVDEPGLGGVNDSSIYFGLWAGGKNLAISAWNSLGVSFLPTPLQVVGDPFVVR